MARQRLCIGVDIGTSGVKVCQLRQAKKELRLVNYASQSFPADTVVDGADAFFPAWDAAAWREISRTPHAADARHAHAFEFVEYRRA